MVLSSFKIRQSRFASAQQSAKRSLHKNCGPAEGLGSMALVVLQCLYCLAETHP